MGFKDEFQIIDTTLKTTPFPGPFFKSLAQPFKIILAENQNFEKFRITGIINRINNFTAGKAEIFLNNKKIGDFFWNGNPFGGIPETWVIDQNIALGVLKRNEDNILTVEVEQGIIGGDEWGISLFAKYELNTIEAPERPPELGDPVEDDGSAQCSPFDISCMLFGDAQKATKTIIVMVGGLIVVIGLVAVAKLIRG